MQRRRNRQDDEYDQRQWQVYRRQQHECHDHRNEGAAEAIEANRQQPPDHVEVGVHARDQVAGRVMLVEPLFQRQQVVVEVAPNVEADRVGDLAAVDALPVEGDHRNDRQPDQERNVAEHLRQA